MRIALTSGLIGKKIADDLGIGMSNTNKWITAHRDTDVVSKEDLSLAQENERLRPEIRFSGGGSGQLFGKDKCGLFRIGEPWRLPPGGDSKDALVVVASLREFL